VGTPTTTHHLKPTIRIPPSTYALPFPIPVYRLPFLAPQPLGTAGEKSLIFARETTDNRSGGVWAAWRNAMVPRGGPFRLRTLPVSRHCSRVPCHSPRVSALSARHSLLVTRHCFFAARPLGTAGEKSLIFAHETTDNRSGGVWAARMNANVPRRAALPAFPP